MATDTPEQGRSIGGNALTTPSPPISTAQAERIVAEHYGITATAQRLAGEKDENFRLSGGDQDFFLKVAHVGEPAATTNLVTSALLHLARVRADLPVQRVVPTIGGAPELCFETESGDLRRSRMTTFLDGRLLRSVPSSQVLRENLGRILARLALALRTFEHPAARREMLWDVRQADTLWPMLDALHMLQDHAMLVRCLEHFNAELGPRLALLRQQPVHNDLSTDNVLIAGDSTTVSGIIDFGDMVVTQVINDIAVAAAGQLTDGDDPFAPAIDLVRGYHEIIPLCTAELEILYDLVRVRIAMYIIIAGWRSMRFPENSAYIMRKSSLAWTQLHRLPASAAPEVGARLIDACHNR